MRSPRLPLRRRAPWRAPAVAVVAAATLAACSSTGSASGAPASPKPPASYYLSLGDSLSVGYQPTAAHPKGQDTNAGYADDLFHQVAATHPGLTLVKLGCPGETTGTMMHGGDCHYAQGSQLAAAEAFLRSHGSSTALVTVDIGANDLDICAEGGSVNAACVSKGMASVTSDLPVILQKLRTAAPGVPILTMNLYDPFLAAYLRGPSGAALANASLPLLRSLNATITRIAGADSIPTADVATAFDSYDMTSTAPLSGHGTVPAAVARICTLTWICAAPPLGPNIHPNATGYRTIAGAFTPLLPATLR